MKYFLFPYQQCNCPTLSSLHNIVYCAILIQYTLPHNIMFHIGLPYRRYISSGQSFVFPFCNVQERKLDASFFRQNVVYQLYGKTELKQTKSSLSPKKKLWPDEIYLLYVISGAHEPPAILRYVIYSIVYCAMLCSHEIYLLYVIYSIVYCAMLCSLYTLPKVGLL